MNSSCGFIKKNQQRCKRSIAEGQRFCWQHARGIRARWRSLTRNQSLIFALTILGVFATFAFGIYSLLQSSTNSDRAYLSFVGFGNAIVNNSPTGQVWGYLFPLQWSNNGSTEAHGQIKLGHQFSKNALPSDFDFPTDKSSISNFNVAPKNGVAWDYDFQLSDLQALQQHSARYFIWGTLTYHDLPKSPMHLHEFCIEIVHVMTRVGSTDLSNPVNTPFLKYNNCPKHNCDDENCTDYAALAKELS